MIDASFIGYRDGSQSVVSLGYSQNGGHDIVTSLEHVKPHAFIPNHMTAIAVEG
jgi:hypothetical protein